MPIGCSRHTAAIFDRGGMTRIGALDTLASVSYSRVRDDMSACTADITATTAECARLLEKIEPNRHELVIFRDGDRVWEGPISWIEYNSGGISIEAKDVTYYLYRLVMRDAYDDSAQADMKVHNRLARIIKAQIARREAESPPVNVLPFGIVYTGSADTKTKRVTPERFSTVFEELDHMAQYAGLDYTVVGRRLVLSDVHTVFHTTPEVTEADFRGEVIVTAYGMQMASEATATDGQGVWGSYGGADPYYGSWEILATSQQEEGDTDPSAAPTDPDPAVLANQAKSMLNGTNPVPFVVRLPDGTSLAPGGKLTFENLVPGARVPLRATLTPRKFSMMQKLDQVNVSDSGKGEQITVTMSQASDLDVPLTGSYAIASAT